MTAAITEFKGTYRYLSNFYICEVEYEGEVYPSSEHAYQAAKSFDAAYRQMIKETVHPSKAKGLGRHTLLRPEWEKVKIAIMHNILIRKFTHNASLGVSLLMTGDAYLEEGNNHGDVFWGTVNGEGRNALGTILMTVRLDLKEIYDHLYQNNR